MRTRRRSAYLFTAILLAWVFPASAQQPDSRATASSNPELVIIDTDIGDDIDDAFAIGLALQSPELKILGITTAWGNTPLRARLTERFLKETGHADVPVAVGIEKYPAKGTLNFTQAQYAQRGPQRTWPRGGFFAGGDSRASR